MTQKKSWEDQKKEVTKSLGRQGYSLSGRIIKEAWLRHVRRIPDS